MACFSRNGFSLVELSIVLVILGLLTGGILTGRALIHAAELRKVTREAENFRSAVFAFRDKYIAWPGDLTNATGFWGKDTAYCNGAAGTAGSPGTCNGDGNGLLSMLYDAGEPRYFWQHLANAGLIEGTYTLPASGGLYQSQLSGSAAPASVIGGGWTAVTFPSSLATIAMLYPSARDRLLLSLSNGNKTGDTTTSFSGIGADAYGVMLPEDAWNIDQKMDDTKPGTGKVTAARYTDGGTLATQHCTSSIDETVAIYNLTGTYSQLKYCGLLFSVQ